MIDLIIILLSVIWLLLSTAVLVKEEITFRKKVKLLNNLISTSNGRQRLSEVLMKGRKKNG